MTDELERLRRMRLAQIQQEKTRPVGLAIRIFPKLLYGDGHAYSMPLTGLGTEEAVARITRDPLVGYHDTWFKPNNATMIVVDGRITAVGAGAGPSAMKRCTSSLRIRPSLPLPRICAASSLLSAISLRTAGERSS